MHSARVIRLRPTRPAEPHTPRVAPRAPLVDGRDDAAHVEAVHRLWREREREDRRHGRRRVIGAVLSMLLWFAWQWRADLIPWRDPQRALDRLAPELTLGAPPAPSALARYDFHMGGIAGYTDARAPATDGVLVSHVIVRGTAPLDPREPTDAPVARVELVVANASSIARVEATLRQALGRPIVRCDASGERVSYWPAGYRGETTLDVSGPGGDVPAVVSIAQHHFEREPRMARSVPCR